MALSGKQPPRHGRAEQHVSGTCQSTRGRSGFHLPIIPASFFGSVLGLAGLGGCWRAAGDVWAMPAIVGESLLALATLIWAALLVLYVMKWIVARPLAVAELQDPVQCCFLGLLGVATMLIAAALLPYGPNAAAVLFAIGVLGTFGFAIWRTGQLWQGERDVAATTPVLYLPVVAGSLVTAAGAANFGHRDWAQLAFGAGLFTWLAIESVLLDRLYTGPELPPALRPTLGIQLAPPAVGAVAYMGAHQGPPDLVAHALVGYGLLQGALLVRLLPWITRQPFAPSYWALTFGATALATAVLRLVQAGDAGALATLAPWLFVGANVVVALVAYGSIRLLIAGRVVHGSRPTAVPSAKA